MLGDFNLDWSRRFDTAYSHKNYYEDMEENLGGFNLNQVVNFETWTRAINGIVKQSILDHIHLVNPYFISELKKTDLTYSDHLMGSILAL